MSRKSIEERVIELEDGKQDELISGTTIKTINGASVLGSGNLVVTGSGAAWGGITGTLSSQTDLQTAFDGKVDENAAITGATKTKITFDAKGLVTSGADATTADIAESTNKLYVSDGDKGDITVSSSGTVWNIDAATVGVTELSATGTPSATTFLRGDNTWATPNNNPEGWSVIVKTANQDVTNSVTLVDDTDLQFSVVANGMYMIELDLIFSANNTTGDYQNRFAISSGNMKGKGFMIGPTATGAAQVNEYAANAATTTTPLSLGSPSADLDFPVSVKIIFSFYASANATFSYQFANVAAAVGRTSRTMKGSILKYKKIN